MADAGFVKEAKEVLEANRKGIERAFPDMVGKLNDLIQERLELNGLPAQLVAKLEQLKSANGVSHNSNLVPRYARFRVIDQNENPIDKAAVSVVCNGNDKQLMDFANGHYLITYNGYRSSDDEGVCDLVVNWPRLDSKQFKLRATADRVNDAGVFVVPRLDESVKVPYKFRVLDPVGKPILWGGRDNTT